jgi:hypothetical protein
MTLFLTLATLVLTACSDESAPLEIGLTADLIGQDTPVRVTTSPIIETESGFEHEVRIAWQGEQTVRLDDTRSRTTSSQMTETSSLRVAAAVPAGIKKPKNFSWPALQTYS